MMRHASEEELVLYGHGELKNRERIAAHLKECADCRKTLARIESVFAGLNAMEVPDPGEGYEQRLWRQLAPRLPQKSGHWWEGFFAPRRLLAVGVLATLIVLAFVAGRITNRPHVTETTLDANKVRERVLVVAVGEHLGRSEMVLMELENAQPAVRGQKSVDISATQRRAEDLLEENRL
jgi:hypothetical protein